MPKIYAIWTDSYFLLQEKAKNTKNVIDILEKLFDEHREKLEQLPDVTRPGSASTTIRIRRENDIQLLNRLKQRGYPATYVFDLLIRKRGDIDE